MKAQYVQEIRFGDRRVCLYRMHEGSIPLVYSIDYHENGELILNACSSIGCAPFNLVTISGLQWNGELSPWPAGTVVSSHDGFTGGADEFLDLLTGDIVPSAERMLDAPPAWRCLTGYSLAGLFALYAAHKTPLFTRILSASGSMWYPRLTEWAQERAFASTVQGLYMSVGDKESTSRNAVLHTVGERTEGLAMMYAQRGINVKFELNPGNHFKNPPLRVAKGIKWLLETTGELS